MYAFKKSKTLPETMSVNLNTELEDRIQEIGLATSKLANGFSVFQVTIFHPFLLLQTLGRFLICLIYLLS